MEEERQRRRKEWQIRQTWQEKHEKRKQRFIASFERRLAQRRKIDQEQQKFSRSNASPEQLRIKE